MDENNNNNIFGSFDNNNIQNTYNPDPANNTSNTYEPFENNMPYEQNNDFANNAQFNQTNNFDSTNLYNLDNDIQFNQDNNFDNSTMSNPVNNDVNSFQQFDNLNGQYNNTQYSQNYDSNVQYDQPNNYDNTQYTPTYDNNVQYSQSNSYDNTQYTQNYDNNMQYGQAYDNSVGYTQNDNTQYEQANNDVNTYQPFNNTNNGYNPVSNFDNTNTGYNQVNNFDNTTGYNQNANFDNGMNNGSDYSLDFEKTWMGKIYDKAHSKKFNWCSAFFSGTYFMYRKMYLSGLLLVILYSLMIIIPSLMFFGDIITSVPLYATLLVLLPLIFMIISGFMFYPLYRSFVNKKFNSLKATITDNSALVNEANNKGGTSVLGVVMALIVNIIIISVGLGSIIANAKDQLNKKLPNNEPDDPTNEITEPVTDMKSFNFLNEYSVQYDSLSWFFNPIDNSLTKGNYILTYSGQYLDDIKNNFNVDVTNNAGRSSLLNSLVSNLEAQAAAINLSVEVTTNSFVADNNSYYAYLDIISDSAISRYYLLLLPERDILFQFILSSNDTNIDYATSLEVINILTSISYENAIEPDNEDGNVIENEITNQISGTANEVPSGLINDSNTVENGITENNSNSVSTNSINSNEVAGNNSSNTVDVNATTENNQVPLQSILN